MHAYEYIFSPSTSVLKKKYAYIRVYMQREIVYFESWDYSSFNVQEKKKESDVISRTHQVRAR